jgi:L-amino acid N-acyltransferase YncA
VAPEWKNTMFGVELYAAVLQELRKQKVRRIVTSISAVNTNVMNLYSMLGFRFSTPEIVYHWHSRREPS